MDYDDNDEDYFPPHHACLFRSPKEINLRAEYELNSPSIVVRRLFSERNREIYSEAFIENDRLGTLIDLCIEAVAKLGSIRSIPAIIRNDPLKMRIYYDSLDVDLPLKECLMVSDLLYWRRVVLAKSSNQVLKLKKLSDYDWKSKGVTLKYVELVESCPAEFWPEKEMTDLALLIKGHVKSMHIRRLQPLPATAFTQYVESDTEVDVTSSSSEIEEISSDEPDTESDNELEQETGEEGDESQEKASDKSSNELFKNIDVYSSMKFSVIEADSQRIDRQNARHVRNAARQQLRNIQAKRKAEHERRRHHRLMKRYTMDIQTKLGQKKKVTKRRKKIKGVFDIPVEPEPSDGDDKIPDKRNKERLLRRIRRFDYPSEHCHHIDLSFVRHFDNLVSFHLEFLGPPGSVRDFHNRYLKFSFDDISRLGKGLRSLEQLKIFRLRNSPLDRTQMQVLARALKTLNMLEEVDFGYDQISDDCSIALTILLERERMLKVLQLEYNKLGKTSMEAIVLALSQYEGEEPLDYLGLAHNPITAVGLPALFRYLVDTNHVEKLNISGIEVGREIVANEVCRLLRQHSRLRHLEMAAIPLDPHIGVEILRALKSNKDVIYLDSRDCDLGEDVEFEIDIILRRNRFLLNNKYVGGICTSEESICKLLMQSKHPILAKVQREEAKRAECLRDRVYESSSKTSILKAVEAKRETIKEYDIWEVLGVKSQLSRHSKRKSECHPSVAVPSMSKPFTYNPNLYDLDQFREYVHQPGPSNRYYYLKNNRNP